MYLLDNIGPHTRELYRMEILTFKDKQMNYAALTGFVWMIVIVVLVNFSLPGCSQQIAAPTPEKVTNSSESAAVHKSPPKPKSQDQPLIDPSPVTR